MMTSMDPDDGSKVSIRHSRSPPPPHLTGGMGRNIALGQQPARGRDHHWRSRTPPQPRSGDSRRWGFPAVRGRAGGATVGDELGIALGRTAVINIAVCGGGGAARGAARRRHRRPMLLWPWGGRGGAARDVASGAAATGRGDRRE